MLLNAGDLLAFAKLDVVVLRRLLKGTLKEHITNPYFGYRDS